MTALRQIKIYLFVVVVIVNGISEKKNDNVYRIFIHRLDLSNGGL